jgi:MurNAc alpha-1-phosphate uridylyltransferase
MTTQRPSRAMILAAGRGERMRPLTDRLPKPLLEVGGKALIEYHVENLARAGVREIVINHARFGAMIEARLGRGEKYGVDIVYSAEGDEPLETGGGIHRALPLIGDGPFIVVNADVWTDLDFSSLHIANGDEAHLMLVANPAHHPEGDFGINGDRLDVDREPRFTYSGVGTYRAALFRDCAAGRFPLAPLIRNAARHRIVGATLFSQRWVDVGTPERLRQLDRLLNPEK